jgi:hypothetical protein
LKELRMPSKYTKIINQKEDDIYQFNHIKKFYFSTKDTLKSEGQSINQSSYLQQNLALNI